VSFTEGTWGVHAALKRRFAGCEGGGGGWGGGGGGGGGGGVGLDGLGGEKGWFLEGNVWGGVCGVSLGGGGFFWW